MSLDRKGITTALANFFKADTTTLYGRGKLIQLIENKTALFSKAKVNNNNPNGIYLHCPGKIKTQFRLQNADYDYTINLRFESIQTNPEKAANTLDDALEQIDELINNEGYSSGDLFSSYYTDANAKIISVDLVESVFEPPELNENKRYVTEIEGAIIVTINKLSTN
jgi:hypothetical protein